MNPVERAARTPRFPHQVPLDPEPGVNTVAGFDEGDLPFLHSLVL